MRRRLTKYIMYKKLHDKYLLRVVQNLFIYKIQLQIYENNNNKMRVSHLTLEYPSPGQDTAHKIPRSNLRVASEAGKPSIHLILVTLGKGGEDFPRLFRMFKVEIPNEIINMHGGTIGLLSKIFTVVLTTLDLTQQSVKHPRDCWNKDGQPIIAGTLS